MAMDSLLALVCASAVVAAGPSTLATAGSADAPDQAVATTLAVQTALQQGREHLLHGEYKAAVATLEGQLPFINGNQVYLKLLQDAYRAYIKKLRLAKQEEEAQRYLRRLLILDRGAILDNPPGNLAAASPAAASVAKPSSVPEPTSAASAYELTPEQDPFHSSHAFNNSDNRARNLLERAEQEFGSRRYREARSLYERAYQTDKSITATCVERWAYCKLFCVVEQLNQSQDIGPYWSDLEQEVRQAVDLAPKLEYGKQLLAEIQKRRPTLAPARESKGETTVVLRYYPRNTEGWYAAESANFRIFYTLSQEWADRAALVAEQTRAAMQQKWFGNVGETWQPKCDLYLHATGQDYTRITGQSNSPGHSSLKMENGRLVTRRIDLHCDDPNLLAAVLPHETTHVVLAGQFGEQLVPRWADEGMAVLTEPHSKIERHLNNLAKCRQDGTLFRLQDLMQLDDYPRNPRYISAFYAQSVSLVDYLSNLRGPQTFAIFLQEGLRYGYEKPLHRLYGYRNFAELEQRWAQHAFPERATLTGLTRRTP